MGALEQVDKQEVANEDYLYYLAKGSALIELLPCNKMIRQYIDK